MVVHFNRINIFGKKFRHVRINGGDGFAFFSIDEFRELAEGYKISEFRALFKRRVEAIVIDQNHRQDNMRVDGSKQTEPFRTQPIINQGVLNITRFAPRAIKPALIVRIRKQRSIIKTIPNDIDVFVANNHVIDMERFCSGSSS